MTKRPRRGADVAREEAAQPGGLPSRPSCPVCGVLLRHGECVVHGSPRDELMAPEDVLRAEREPPDPHRPWSPAEVAYALKAAGSMTSEEIGEALDRSAKSVKSWFRRNNLSLPRVKGKRHDEDGPAPDPRHGRRWSAEELALMEDGQMRILLRSRSETAIVRKASRDGMPLRSSDGCLSARQVAATYGVRPATIIAWIDRGMIPARQSGGLLRIEPDDAARIVPRLKSARSRRPGWWSGL